MAVTEAVKEALWLKGLAVSLGLEEEIPTVLCDSQSAIHVTQNQMFHERTKHIDISSPPKTQNPGYNKRAGGTKIDLEAYSRKSTFIRTQTEETIFFDGGAHYGDLLANLLLGFTLLWLPLTLAAVFRGFYLRYRFTNLRVTVISGLTGQDRSDFSYNVIKDVQVVPRFIGEWGDVIITLKDGTKVDLRSVPKFREIAKYCLAMAEKPLVLKEGGAKGF
ncbi:hypothetical protein BUALT_Bualt17G0067300 [Buddleja alternifolia]|uniref:YdbS-like PH domain-containing protein n=1 Tax=Buddleja alternifolia TaxID=168488 RepID=A0AAV6WFS5_9LAMI|nr:hypothetical protein BUALT_Bualt17G0067300 [Buddleja alternifolia]